MIPSCLAFAGFMRDITDGQSGKLKQLFIEATEKGVLVEV